MISFLSNFAPNARSAAAAASARAIAAASRPPPAPAAGAGGGTIAGQLGGGGGGGRRGDRLLRLRDERSQRVDTRAHARVAVAADAPLEARVAQREVRRFADAVGAGARARRRRAGSAPSTSTTGASWDRRAQSIRHRSARAARSPRGVLGHGGPAVAARGASAGRCGSRPPSGRGGALEVHRAQPAVRPFRRASMSRRGTRACPSRRGAPPVQTQRAAARRARRRR